MYSVTTRSATKIPDSSDEEGDAEECVSETPTKKRIENTLSGMKEMVNQPIPIPMLRLEKCNPEDYGLSSPEVKKCDLQKYSASTDALAMLKKMKEESAKNKARASLFQDKASNSDKQTKIVLSAKSFYGPKEDSPKVKHPVWDERAINSKKQKSPANNSAPKRSISRKKRYGAINCGVGHNIKRPKIKRLNTSMEKLKIDIKVKENVLVENFNPVDKYKVSLNNSTSELNSEKKFFKNKATELVTKPIVVDKIFDIDDSMTEEGASDKSEEISKVDNIIQMLEKDWKDDESDEMEAMEADSPVNSPSKNSDASSAYELSNTDVAMNIKDVTSVLVNDVNENSNEKSVETTSPKLYPLFTKGYTLKDDDKIKKSKKSNSWQLSKKYSNSHDQYQLDAGQKIFGAIQCEECKIIYHAGDAEDENAHLNYHNNYKTLKFVGWKNERIMYEDAITLSRIIMIEPKDPSLQWKKVMEVLEFIDNDLGISDVKLTSYRNKKVYLYIRDKTVVGVLVAEHIEVAFRMIPDLPELNCCTSESTPVKCGINMVWTAINHRNQGIATKLVDILRSTYYFGYIMSTEDIAFSIPSVSGKKFAEKYTKSKTFKVY